MTTLPLFLLPATAEAKCLSFWVNPATGKEECLRINSGYSRRNREISDGIEILDNSDNGEKKFRIQPTRCGQYRVRLVDKDYETKKRRLNTYWLGNNSNFSVLNSRNLSNSPRVRVYPGSINQRNRQQRYQYQTPQRFKTEVKTEFNGNYQTSGSDGFSSCQNYYYPQGN
ncbi:MAG: hypothetical protein EAZ76_06230 [Nostocales cyanobacterium]|nr:MAG: hypothetical protein EAZ87_21355 [Nostocales cyanobacterium]TAF17107.1 MAG: hypothetical protein EAZ76_06230 [Nostocales cyanobacterium]